MSVVEHLTDPIGSFTELARVLKPKGVLIAQTPRKYDYMSLLAHGTPTWFHKCLLSNLLDRRAEDVFPACSQSNTRKAMAGSLEAARLRPLSIQLLNQYPDYRILGPLLFRLGIYYERFTSKYEALAQLRRWILEVAQKNGGKSAWSGRQ